MIAETVAAAVIKPETVGLAGRAARVRISSGLLIAWVRGTTSNLLCSFEALNERLTMVSAPH